MSSKLYLIYALLSFLPIANPPFASRKSATFFMEIPTCELLIIKNKHHLINLSSISYPAFAFEYAHKF